MDQQDQRMYVEVAPDAPISDRLRSALEELSAAVAEAEGIGEVEGFAMGSTAMVDIGTQRVLKPRSGSPELRSPGQAAICIGDYGTVCNIFLDW